MDNSMKETEIYKGEVPSLNSEEHIDVAQEKYKSLIEAQSEEVSTETEMKLLQLTLDQLSLDLESADLSDAEKREKELRKQDMETKMRIFQEKLAHLQSATDILTPPTADHDQLCEVDERTMALAFEAIHRFRTAVKNYADYTRLLKFSETTVLARGITQVNRFMLISASNICCALAFSALKRRKYALRSPWRSRFVPFIPFVIAFRLHLLRMCCVIISPPQFISRTLCIISITA